jgi:purine nucleoside permease
MKHILGALALLGLAAVPARADRPIPVRVVVVTTFEIGPDSGPNSIGEFDRWVTNLPLPDTIAFPQGFHHLRYNADKQVLGIETGEGPVHAASSITALGHDPRFDLSHAYWVVAAIAGVDANHASVGSAAWASFVVDGDLAFEIDAREIPPDWSTGYVPLNRFRPYQKPVPPVNSISGDQVFTLNKSLVDWAFGLTRDIKLPDDANLQKVRSRYVGFPQAQQPPVVLEGDTLSAGTFWTGALLNQWAENWVAYWTQGKARFVTTAEEDAGIMQALTFLTQAGRADIRRALVLRTASDYSQPPPGESAAAFLKGEATASGLSGFIESLDAAYMVASPVVNEISGNWSKYENNVP